MAERSFRKLFRKAMDCLDATTTWILRCRLNLHGYLVANTPISTRGRAKIRYTDEQRGIEIRRLFERSRK